MDFKEDLTDAFLSEVTTTNWARGGRGNRVRVRRFVSTDLGGDGMGSFNDSTRNVAAAVLLRQLYYKEVGVAVSRPVVNVNGRLDAALSAIRRYVKRVPRYSWDRFLSTYTGLKLSRYENARDTLRYRPITAKDAEVKAFLKYEKIDQDSVPRVISPRSFRYLAAAGRYLKAYEAPLYRVLKRMFGETVVMKGMNSVDQARLMRSKWNKRVSPVAVGLDASRFDQHVSIPMLKWEHKVWRMMAEPQDRDNLGRLLDMQLVNKCRFLSEGKLHKYTLKGQRMSGDMNTGSGNCMLMCSMVYSYMHSKGFGPGQYGFVNNGDDAVLFLDGADVDCVLDGFAEWFREIGFIMKIEEPVTSFEKVEFCQTQPVLSGGRYRMVRTLAGVLRKDNMCMHTIVGLKSLREWLYGVGVAGVRLNSGVPVLQELYLMYQRVGLESKSKRPLWVAGLEWLGRGLPGEPTEIDEQARVSFWRAFGVAPAAQRDLENHLSVVNAVSLAESHRVLRPLLPRGISELH